MAPKRGEGREKNALGDASERRLRIEQALLGRVARVRGRGAAGDERERDLLDAVAGGGEARLGGGHCGRGRGVAAEISEWKLAGLQRGRRRRTHVVSIFLTAAPVSARVTTIFARSMLHCTLPRPARGLTGAATTK